MSNISLKKLLKEYKESVIKESSNPSNLVKQIAKDAADTYDLWLGVDINEFLDGDKQTQADLINDSFNDYIDDVYDDIEGELPDGMSVDKWLKKYKKKLILMIVKKIIG